MAHKGSLADVPLDTLLEAWHAAAKHELSLRDASAREAARRSGKGRWARVESGAVISLDEATDADKDAVWLNVSGS